jgi:hypothetical protein
VDSTVTPELLGRLLDEHSGALALFAAQWIDQADETACRKRSSNWPKRSRP